MPVLPLTILCENVILQNYLSLKDLGDTRYQLIQRVLTKLNAQQLNDLESNNPKLMLDDESIWFNLVKKEFPQDVQERYTTNLSKIKDFFKQQLDQIGFDHTGLNLDNYITYIQLGNTKKYRLPSKLLYMKYQQDYLEKEELAVENLRQRMKAIRKDKEENRVVHIDDIIPVGNNRILKQNKNKPERSKIFMKSKVEAKHRQTLFRNPVGSTPVMRPPRIVQPRPIPLKSSPMVRSVSLAKPTQQQTPISRPLSRPKIITSPLRSPIRSRSPIILSKPTSLKTSPNLTFEKPVISKPIVSIGPIEPKSSVFNKKFKSPVSTRPMVSEPAIISEVQHITKQNELKESNDNESDVIREPPRKRINLGEYKTRKMES